MVVENYLSIESGKLIDTVANPFSQLKKLLMLNNL